ncbi:hypothetical protein BKA65DRAFT_553949 [Rhexocercosporidium sp. MPI-PUGE-AT-0058]|nr:hypothetical protein BKA65DRAFT_553949 [Rhexocercosporidium sp. MPI-PUGE-AT-0058]
MSSATSDFTEVSAGGVNTPTASESSSFLNANFDHGVLSVVNPTPSTPPRRQHPQNLPNSPTKVPGILNGNFAAITGQTSDGISIDRSFINPSVTNAKARYVYSTFRRVPVTLSFGFTQEPTEWHKVVNFVADVPALIRTTIEAMSHSEDGATKLLLVLVFSQVYFDNWPEFWKMVRLEAAEQLFSFVGAPDLYLLHIENHDYCASTAIKSSGWKTYCAYYEVSRNGSILWLNEKGYSAHNHPPVLRTALITSVASTIPSLPDTTEWATPTASNASTVGGNEGPSVASSGISQRFSPIRVAQVNVHYQYATFPRRTVFDSFSLEQPAAEWHKIMAFAPGLMEATNIIEGVLKDMAASQNGASKLVLVLVFCEVYSKNHPQFWTQVRVIATEELFNFVGAPDRYYCDFDGLSSCGHTLIKTTEGHRDTVSYRVLRNGDVSILSGEDRYDYMHGPGNFCLGELPKLFVRAL